MALIPGALQFGARVQRGTPLVLPRPRSPYNTAVIKAGHPLTLISGNQVQVASNSGGNINASKIWGFALQDENAASVSDLPTGFATMPKLYFNSVPSQFEDIQTLPADGNTIFSMAVISGQTVSAALVGNAYAFAWDNTNKQVTINPANTALALATVIAIRPGDFGKTDGTGQVDFIVQDSKSQYLQGA